MLVLLHHRGEPEQPENLVQPVNEASGFPSQMTTLSHFRTLSPLRTLLPHSGDLRTLSHLSIVYSVMIMQKNIDLIHWML